MRKDELSVNELLWLAMEATCKCPHCNADILVNPKNIGFRMGATIHNNTTGKVEKTEPCYVIDCDKCGATCDVVFSIELKGGK